MLLVDDVQFLEDKRADRGGVLPHLQRPSRGRQPDRPLQRPPARRRSRGSPSASATASNGDSAPSWTRPTCAPASPSSAASRGAARPSALDPGRAARRSPPASRANVRQLEGALNRVLAFASMMDQPLDRELVRDVLDPQAASAAAAAEPRRRRTLEADPGGRLRRACIFHRMTSSAASARRRSSRARQLAIHLARERLGLSLAQLGRAFDRDRTTILHSIRAVERDLVPDSNTSAPSSKSSAACDAPPASAELRADTRRPPTCRLDTPNPPTKPMPQRIPTTSPTHQQLTQEPRQMNTVNADEVLRSPRVTSWPPADRRPRRLDSQRDALARRHPPHRGRRLELELRSTDMELSLILSAEAKIETEGSVLLPGRLLADVVRSLPGSEVTLALRPEQRDVEIEASGSTFHLRTLPADEFPRLPEFEGESVKIPGRAARRDGRARRPRGLAGRGAPDPHRHPRHGRGEDADDGRDRLLPAQRQAHRARGADRRSELEANVPARAMRELSRLIAQEAPRRSRSRCTRNQILFRVGGVVLASRLIEGQFPSYRQLLPEIVRARGAAAARGAPRRHPAGQPARAAKRAAAVRVRRGRADGRGRDPRRRRRQRVDAGAVSAASRSRSRSTRSS